MPQSPPSLSDVIAAAGRPGHAHCKAVLGAVSPWLVVQARAHGLDVTGLRHSIDTSAVRHIQNRHGNGKIEASRGQQAVTAADIAGIPKLLAAPDQLVFGGRTARGQPIIGYIKRLPDGATLYLEEMRAGRRTLSALSLRKYPAATLLEGIAASLESNGRTDGGITLHIAQAWGKVTAIQKVPAAGTIGSVAKKYGAPVLGVLLLAAAVFGLRRALGQVRLRDVTTAMTAVSYVEIGHALELLALCLVIMAMYDVPGILFAKTALNFPALAWRRIGLASFCAYALSHVLGAPALSGAAIRLRLYAQWGVPAAGIGRIVALSGTMFALGSASLFGGILLFHPSDLPLFGHDVSAAALRALGGVLWLVTAAYVLAARGATPLSLFGHAIPKPGAAIALGQVLLSCADTATACGILFALLPAGLSYPHVLGIYLAGFAGGLVSGLPGGVGVFDTVLLLGLAGTMPPAAAIGAILLFRVFYYLLPAALAAMCFAGHELWMTLRRGRS